MTNNVVRFSLFVTSIFVIFLLMLLKNSQDATMQKVADSLPTELFDALGGKAGIRQLPREILFTVPLFDDLDQEIPEERKRGIVSLDVENINNYTMSHQNDQKSEILSVVSVIIVPKVAKGHEQIKLAFSNKHPFLMGVFDEKGTDFISGSVDLLEPSNKNRLRNFEAKSQRLLDILIQSLKNTPPVAA